MASLHAALPRQHPLYEESFLRVCGTDVSVMENSRSTLLGGCVANTFLHVVF